MCVYRGWENGTLPVNEALLREYLKSAAALKKLDTLNITGTKAISWLIDLLIDSVTDISYKTISYSSYRFILLLLL